MLNTKNTDQLVKQGKILEDVNIQIQHFIDGFPFMKLVRPAVIGDGILELSENDLKKSINIYNDAIKHVKTIKFVPASGAASRMFKDLFSFMDTSEGISWEDLKNNPSFSSIDTFFNSLSDFSFYLDLKSIMAEDDLDLDDLVDKGKFSIILKYFLTEKGLNYGGLAKGLLKFHHYDNRNRTPVGEHLVEGALYASGNNQVYLHFTVSPEHEEKFRDHISEVVSDFAEAFQVKYTIGFSQQKPSTDTIAVGPDNTPFIHESGEILFRPAGHGALIENLNELDGDIIFVKNIDNIVPDHLKEDTVNYKKALAGKLLEYQERIFYYLSILEQETTLGPSFMEEISAFIKNELGQELSEGQEHVNAKEYFIKKLNRPIRVCGMVKNEGEPGGGPFWAENQDGTVSLQIVESAQVDPDNEEQQKIAKSATHFNPVDLVCGIKNYKGVKFDLKKFVDPQTGFISKKSQGGRDLKALELPGLWNGAMSNWNTIFVEVPIMTFNPVKVVNDLLRSEHQ